MACDPTLLNPIRLISACCSPSRNILGRGFPCCACSVIPPTSMKPNPSVSQALRVAPCLSMPAANPRGFLNVNPSKLTGLAILGRLRRRSQRPIPFASIKRRPRRARAWACSEPCTAKKRLGQQGIHPRHRRESERDILQGLRPWCAVRDTDARWPSLRELARIVLREEDPVLCLPAPFCDDARVMLRDLTEHDATRIHVLVVVEGPPSVKVDGVMLGQLGGQEPTFAVVWVPGSDKDWCSVVGDDPPLIGGRLPRLSWMWWTGCVGSLG